MFSGGKGALGKAAVTPSEAKENFGRGAAHEIMHRNMPVSWSVVEARPKASSVLLPQATTLTLNLSGSMVRVQWLCQRW